MSGKFIVVEGVRGSGKSSLIREALEEAPDCIYVEDFDAGRFSKEMRQEFLNPENPWGVRLALAYAAKVHLQERIAPKLARGKSVICERWYPSVEAYLLYPNGFEAEVSDQANQLFGIREPDLTVVCTVDFEIAMERLEAAGREPNIFEERGPEFMRKVCRYYNSLCDGVQADTLEIGLDLILRELGG